MNLIDGRNYYEHWQGSDWQWTRSIETDAEKVVESIKQQGDRPTTSALDAAYGLLLEIEKWKAMCLGERMIYGQQNSKQTVWGAFLGAVNASNDRDAILSIMRLKGFGSSRNESTGKRPAKVASAALRFLRPADWGVVDWRTAAMTGLLQESGGNVDHALKLAEKYRSEELRDVYKDNIDEDAACAYNQMYRGLQTGSSLLRTADAEMGVFGLSLMAWPIQKWSGGMPTAA